MALKKPLVINDTTGDIEELQSGDSIADPSPDTKSFTSGEALAIRDVVYVSAADEVSKADSDALGTMPAIGIATEAVGSGLPVVVQMDGVVPGFTGLTPGANQYVSGTAGLLTETPPSGTGKVVHRVGYALSATELKIEFGPPMERG